MSTPTDVIFPTRHPVAGVYVSAATYDTATAAIVASAHSRRSALVAATSVHGVTLAARNAAFREQLNSFDMLPPDGQPVRWGLNLLHGVGLVERVYGPTLMLRVCRAAAQADLSVYLYGARPTVLTQLANKLPALVPGLRVAGYRSPPFRALTEQEDAEDVDHILASGASIVLVGLGCPQQERWAYQHRERVPLPIVCVGAAFDFHAGVLRQAPAWLQARGLEWFFRLLVEPRRLWRRYITIVPLYLFLLGREYVAYRLLGGPTSESTEPSRF